MKCPDCKGKGTRALHGIAIPVSEFQEWDDDERESYMRGDYDTTCETCDGKGTVTKEDLDYLREVAAEQRYFGSQY